jgi:hypothetical protein
LSVVLGIAQTELQESCDGDRKVLLLQAIGYLLYLQMNNERLCDRLYWYADINYHLWLVDDSWMSTAYLVFYDGSSFVRCGCHESGGVWGFA